MLPSSVAGQSLATIRGDVESSTGTPIHRARIMVLTEDLGDTLAVFFTDALGHYDELVATNVALDDLPPLAIDEHVITAIYPNPVAGSGGGLSGSVTVEFAKRTSEPKNPQLEIFDVLARRVQPSAHLASGLYFVRLRFDNGVRSPARTLIVTEPGVMQFVLREDPRGSARAAAKSESTGSIASGGRIATVVRVEKDGYVTEESAAELLPETPTDLDFQLDDAPLPTADFAVGGTLVAGQPVTFDASASSGANDEELIYTWSFGDDLQGGGREIAHVYTDGGSFDVTLTVAGDFGAKATATQQVNVANPPPPVASNGTLMGIVSDISGFALGDVDAMIVSSGQTGTTDVFGALSIDDIDIGVPLTVRLTRDGYASQVVLVGAPGDSTATLFFDTAMRPRDGAVQVGDAENGFSRRARDGVNVELPVDALVHQDGSPATGVINLAMTPVDVGDPQEVRSFPGRFEGLQPDGESALLLSFGTAEFSFMQGDDVLQLAPGKMADVQIPVYTSEAAVGDTIPLWSMNETTGAWVREGDGVVAASSSSPSGLVLSARVGHFSWWNIDKPDNEPDVAQGLCYKYECFNGLCNKVKVYCWVEGAIHGDTDKRSELPPPVFSARKYFPVDGGTVPLPGNRDVTLRGTVVDGGAVLRGDTTFTAVQGGSSFFELVIDTLAAAEGTLAVPADTSDAVGTDDPIHLYQFVGNEGQFVALGVGRVSGGSGSWEVHDPQSAVLSSTPIGPDVIGLRLPSTGTYTVMVSAGISALTVYRLQIQTVSASVSVNSNTELAIPPADFRVVQFSPTAGQTLALGVFKPGSGAAHGATVFDNEGDVVAYNNGESVTDNFVAGDGTHYILLVGLPSSDPTAMFGISEVTPDNPQQVALDAFGAADVPGTIGYHGQRRYYEFQAPAGDGLEVSLHRTGEAVPDAQVVVIDATEDEINRFATNDGWTEMIVEGFGTQIENGGVFSVIVQDDLTASRGDYTLRIRTVTPAAAIVVDDDLTCPGAVTTSIAAALHAIPEGGTVTLCNGVYESPSRPAIFRNGVTFTGESEAGAVLRFVDINRAPGAALDARGVGIAIRNMTIETGPKGGGNLTGGILTSSSIDPSTAVFEDLTIRPIEEGESIGPAIDGDYGEVAIRNVTYTKGSFNFQALDVTASTSLVIENSVFDSPVSVRSRAGIKPDMMIDGLTVDEYNVTVIGASELLVMNSTIRSINVQTSDGVTIRDSVVPLGGLSGSGITISQSTPVLIEGNEIHRDIQGSVRAGETLTVRGNRLISSAGVPAILFLGQAFNSEGGTIVVENNLIFATRATSGNVWFTRADDLGSLSFVNNTIVHEQFGNTVETVTTISVGLGDTGFTGALPVTFVNNVLVGDGTTVMTLPAGTTIDADYNLYYNYNVVYAGGASSTGSNDIVGQDPQITGDDYELQAGSPAVNTGATPAQYPAVPAVDYNGVARPQGAGYDRGAHEQ